MFMRPIAYNKDVSVKRVNHSLRLFVDNKMHFKRIDIFASSK